jgi:hypothetical protein
MEQILLEKIIVAHLVEIHSALNFSQRAITVFMRTHHWSLSKAR